MFSHPPDFEVCPDFYRGLYKFNSLNLAYQSDQSARMFLIFLVSLLFGVCPTPSSPCFVRLWRQRDDVFFSYITVCKLIWFYGFSTSLIRKSISQGQWLPRIKKDLLSHCCACFTSCFKPYGTLIVRFFSTVL
jgi:hypothetical protein